MEERIKNLEEKVAFLTDALKVYGILEVTDTMIDSWRNKKDFFRSREL
ncbi:MAG: hypothetical protein WDN09_03925 [bacterium]